MEQIARFILYLKNILLGMEQDKAGETSTKKIEELKKKINELEGIYYDQTISDEDKKIKLIKLIARTEQDLRFDYQNTILGNALQSVFDFNVNEILRGDLSLQQKEKLLSSAKEYYDKLRTVGKKTNAQIDFLTAQTQLSNAIINVIGSKLNQGIAVDYKTEIDEPFIVGVSNSVLKGLSETNNNQSQELTQKLMGQMTLFNMQGGENPLYNPEFWRGYFECIGIIKQNETQVSEQQEIQNEETFAEYRARKIEEYKNLTGRKDIEPGKRQITVIDNNNRVMKVYVNKIGLPTMKVIDNNGKKRKLYNFAENTNVKRIEQITGSKKIQGYTAEAIGTIRNARAAIFGSGIERFVSNLFEDSSELKDVIFHEDISSIGGEFIFSDESSCFKNTAVEEVRLPPYTRELHCGAFEDCSKLHTVYCNSELKVIGDRIFKNTNLTRILGLPDPDTMESLSDDAIAGTPIVEEAIKELEDKDISTYNEVENGTKTYEEWYRGYRQKKIERYELMTGREGIEPGREEVTIIDIYNRVKKIKAPYGGFIGRSVDSMTNISRDAKVVIFGEGIKTLSNSPNSILKYFKKIGHIVFNEDLIYMQPFRLPEIQTLVLPPKYMRVNEGLCYNWSSLERVVLNDGLTEIESDAFEKTPLKGINRIPRSVKSVDLSAFNHTEIEVLVVPKTTAVQGKKEGLNIIRYGEGERTEETIESQLEKKERQPTGEETMREQIRQSREEIAILQEQLATREERFTKGDKDGK